jgi:hypothetical protein
MLIALLMPDWTTAAASFLVSVTSRFATQPPLLNPKMPMRAGSAMPAATSDASVSAIWR